MLPPADATVVSSGLRGPRRSALACTRCRQQKMKCSGGPPSCDRCRKASSCCIYEPPGQIQPQLPPPPLSLPSLPAQFPLPLSAGSVSIAPASQSVTTVLPTQDGAGPHSQEPDGHVGQTSAPSHDFFVAANALAFHPTVPLQPRISPGGTVGDLGPSSAENTGSLSRKRRRGSGMLIDDADGGAPSGSFENDECEVSSPYHTVQIFEAAHRPDEGSSRTSSATIETESSVPSRVHFPHSTGDRVPLLRYLSDVGLDIDDARDMFALFGDKVAPFLPLLYDVDFSDLPNDPLYALAGIAVMARYLPGVSKLRTRLDSAVQTLVRHVLFDDMRRPYEAVLETVRGLAIIYGYSEVGVPGSRLGGEQTKADMLSIKGVIEGYAVRWNIGRPHHSNPLGCAVWLWLYSMSNYCSIVLGCPRTISAEQQVFKARDVVERCISHPQILVLLGEVDLCCTNDPQSWSPHPNDVPDPSRHLDNWIQAWSPLESTPTSIARRLRFHFRFSRFYRLSRQVKDPASANSDVLTAAQDFLYCATKLSPVAKGRIQYMSDFAFVMLVSVCCYILQAVDVKGRECADLRLRGALIQDMREVADLLKSLSATRRTATAAYGRALEFACGKLAQRISIQQGEGDAGQAWIQGSMSQGIPEDVSGHADGLSTTHHVSDDLPQPFEAALQDSGDGNGATGLGEDQTSWLAGISDAPQGFLLDAFCIPWQN